MPFQLAGLSLLVLRPFQGEGQKPLRNILFYGLFFCFVLFFVLMWDLKTKQNTTM